MTESTSETPATGEQSSKTTTGTSSGGTAGHESANRGDPDEGFTVEAPGSRQDPDDESREKAAAQFKEDFQFMQDNPDQPLIRGPVEGVGGESPLPPPEGV